MNKKRVAIVVASVIALAGLSYLTYWYIQKSRTTSSNPEKNDRKINVVINKDA